ncbi:O-antigen ligase family protein [Streptacidiphilus sp. N1-3]|uniref:O-antigen ligase family protein n=1 Tax=Streptacidiphilus alkalitolerans TaxID=3342712 RepID=A0ABV6X9Z0_9ACTN
MTLLDPPQTARTPLPARPAQVGRAAPPPRSRRAAPRDLLGDLLRRPSALAALVVLLVCVPTGDKDVTAAVHITPADVASLGLVALCGWRAATAVARGRGRLIPTRAALLFGGVLVGVAVAAIASRDPSESLSGFIRITQVFVLVPIAMLLSLRDRRDLGLVLGALLGAALIEGAVGAVQYLTGTGASYDGGTVRAVGTFGASDVMAMSAVVSYGLLAALGLALEARAAGRPRAALGYALAAGALVMPLAVSFSRGSWIATGAAVLVALLLTDVRLALRGALFTTAAAVVLVGGLGLGGASVTARLSSITTVAGAPDHSVSDRYDLWTTAARIWQDHPVTGVGPKEFPNYRDAHAPLRLSSGSDTAGAGAGFAREPLLSPHNMYLLVLSEQGLVGLTAFAALFLALLFGTARQVLRERAGRGRAAGLGAALIGLLTWQLVDFLYADIGGTTTVLVSVVLGLAGYGAFTAPGTRAPTAPVPEAAAP